MNKEQRILDFTAFILLDYEELLCGVNYFFSQNELIKLERFITSENDDFFLFLKDFIDLQQVIEYDVVLDNQLNHINDILTNSELYNFIEYINKNFRYGYPDDYEDGLTTGGNYSLNLKTTDVMSYFQNYLKYYRLNNSVFISYFYQLLKDVEYPCQLDFEKEKNKIDNIYKTKGLLSNSLSGEYLEYTKDKYKLNLFENIENNNIQLQGFVDEKGLYVDINKTLVKYLIHLNAFDVKGIVYNTDVSENETFESYLNYLYVEFKLFGIKKNRSNYTSEFEKQLFDDFDELKKNNLELITFLAKKGFAESEIDIVLNVVSSNKFGEINFRNLEITNQVNFFNFCYLFFILDFFTECKAVDFRKENSFDKVLNFNPDFTMDYDKNAFSKYYKYIINENSKANPFSRIGSFLDIIEKQLTIKKDRLKSTDLKNL